MMKKSQIQTSKSPFSCRTYIFMKVGTINTTLLTIPHFLKVYMDILIPLHYLSSPFFFQIEAQLKHQEYNGVQ